MEPAQKRPGTISYGLTSYGYDARVGYKFKVFTAVHCGEVDPKNFDPESFVEFDLTPHDGSHERKIYGASCAHCGAGQGEWMYKPKCDKRPVPKSYVSIPPNSFCLAETVEVFKIPRKCHGLVVGKSTYARCGIIVTMTPLEPEWEGQVTVEISNTTPLPARVYAGEGIMQVLFLESSEATRFAIGQLLEVQNAPHLTELNRVKLENAARSLSYDHAMGSCRQSYADKGGKYQGQRGIVLPKVD